MKENFVSKTPIFNNKTCPEGIKKQHATARGIYGILHVVEGMVEFVWEDSNERIIVDTTKSFKITSERKHHLNLLWNTKFYIEFYKL